MKEENKTRELKKKERKVKEKEDFKLKILRKIFTSDDDDVKKDFLFHCRLSSYVSVLNHRKKEVIVKKLMENKVCAVNDKKI